MTPIKHMNEIQKNACTVLQKAFCILRFFITRPLNDSGKEFLKRVADTASNIPLGLVGDSLQASRFEEDVKVLELMIGDSFSDLYDSFVLATIDEYGIRIFERKIEELTSQNNISQLHHYKSILKRFQGEKERGSEPTYSPKLMANLGLNLS